MAPIDLLTSMSVYIPTTQHTYLLIYLLVWFKYLPTYLPTYLCTFLSGYVPTNLRTYLSHVLLFFSLFFVLFCFLFFGFFAGASSPEGPAGARVTYMFSWKVFGFVCLSANAAAAAVAVVAPALVAARGRGVLFAFYYNAVRRRTLQLGHGGCQSSLLFTLVGSTTSSSFSVTAPESSASSPTVSMWRGFFFFFA